MKCHELHSDRNAEITISTNDGNCPERLEFTKGSVISTYIAVEAGQALGIGCTFNGAAKSVLLDIIIDGVLRFTKKMPRGRKGSKHETLKEVLFLQDNHVFIGSMEVCPFPEEYPK